MVERKLATIEKISEITAIPNADAIVRARIRGWDVVVKKDEFVVGDPCVYFEVDTLLATSDVRFEFLAPRGVRTDPDGNTGHVLKTARLRGQYSQGLVISTTLFPEIGEVTADRIGEDVTAILNQESVKVVKWDPPIPEEVLKSAKGYLPNWFSATSEERVQNFETILGTTTEWEATEKIDGTSTSFYVDGDVDGACTRNLDLLPNENGKEWTLARKFDIFTKLRALGERVVVQGETYGEGHRKNPLRVTGTHFAAFALYIEREEVPRADWPQWLKDIGVPVHEFPFPTNLDEALTQVDKLKSKINPQRAAEGVVWRGMKSSSVLAGDRVVRASFKVISNSYLLKNDL